MKQIVQIPSEKAIVIICGPTTCGKSSIARNILKRCGGKYISYEKIAEAVPKRMPKEKQMLATTKYFAQKIENAVLNEKFAVIETPFIENGQLFGVIVSLRIFGYTNQIVVIKVNLSEELHIDYWQRKHNLKPSKKEILLERATFQKEILATDYNKNGNVKEYVISDPNNVSYEMV